MSDTMYVCVRMGVHMHDVRGVYATQRDATDVAQRLAKTEPDSHHEWVVGTLSRTGGIELLEPRIGFRNTDESTYRDWYAHEFGGEET